MQEVVFTEWRVYLLNHQESDDYSRTVLPETKIFISVRRRLFFERLNVCKHYYAFVGRFISPILHLSLLQIFALVFYYKPLSVSVALMMEAVSTSETLINAYQTSRRKAPEGSCVHTRRREILKSHPSLSSSSE
jgi:hypothetical protein